MPRYEQESVIEEITFDQASFWVQLLGIPLCYKTMEVVIKISSVIGEVSHQTTLNNSDGGPFLYLKMTIDLSLPLCRGRLISLENGKQTRVTFKYECLLNMCC